jgi:GTP diphosphokinase / guanosine-3',5'-bis(diphosphate) 3'-diphosphatase
MEANRQNINFKALADDQMIQSLSRRLIHSARKYFSDKDYADIKIALHAINNECEARSQSEDFKRAYLESVSIALVVIEEISLGKASVIAALLLKFEENGSIPLEIIKKDYGEYQFNLINGFRKINSIPLHQIASQASDLRELIVSLANDVRVILIKLAEFVVSARHISNFKDEDQLKLAYGSMHLYAPLAHRLGLYKLKTELEDIALSIIEPDSYLDIDTKLKETARRRNRFIREFIDPIEKELKKHKIKFEIKGRTKSIFSIWRKMSKQNLEFEEVYDIFAIRIILESSVQNEKEDCWRIYSIVTDIYQPNPLRMRDWISIPKSNGYESLHSTVIGPSGNWVEVQIRSKRMDEIAEKGLAAHWKYKADSVEKGLDDWINNVRDLLDSPSQETDELVDEFKLSLYGKEIFVFTPKGDLKRLPKGATVLDFAFEIHTGVGSTCVGAKINGKNVPIRHVLNNGDRVEIITSKNQKPKQDWLEFVISSKAKNRIKLSLKEEILKESEKGKEILKRRLRNWKIPYNDETIRTLISHYKFKTAIDLYSRIAEERIDLAEIKDILRLNGTNTLIRQDNNPQSTILEYKSDDGSAKSGGYLIIDGNLGNVDYKLAKCCNPIPGDNIFGFVTVNEGIKVHRVNCPNASQLLERFGYRIVKAQWPKADLPASFEVALKISGLDEIGVVSRLTDLISTDLKVNMRSVSLESQDGLYEGVLRILVNDLKHLDILVSRLQKVKGVLSVSRMDFQ